MEKQGTCSYSFKWPLGFWSKLMYESIKAGRDDDDEAMMSL